MAGKQFELEQVLKYRHEMERMRRHEFVEAKRDFETAGDELKREELEIQLLSRQFSENHAEITDIEEMRRYSDFFARKREEIRKMQEQLEMLERIMDERREVLMDATKETKVLESLKEKKLQEFRKERDLKEQAFMDEIALQKQGDSQ